MDDLISRQVALDALAEAMPLLTTPDGCGQFDHDIQVTDEAYVDCMRIIHELPPAQAGWIPSYDGENVPEVGDAVLVTFKNSDGEADVFIARWGGDFYDCGYYYLRVSEVLAFMPLPTPYREGGQDG